MMTENDLKTTNELSDRIPGDILSVLSRSFEDLIYVDLADEDSFRLYRPDPVQAAFFPLEEGKHFFDRCTEDAASFMEEEDLESFCRFFDREKLLNLLDKEDSASMICRGVRGGCPSWHRLLCRYTDEKKQKLVVTSENANREMSGARSPYTVMAGLSHQYLSVFCVDIATGEILDHTRRFTNEEHRINTEAFFRLNTLDERMSLIAEKWVCPTERGDFLESVRLERILEILKKEPVHSVNYRVIQNGEYHFYKCKFVHEKDEPFLIVAIRRRDQDEFEDLQRKRELMEAKARTEEIVEKQTEQLRSKNIALRKMNEGVVELLGSVVEGRDQNSGEHIRRVKGFTYLLARQVMEDLPEYGLNERKINLMVFASALHDVGKIAIPDRILLKPGPLNEEEFEVMKTHCERGCDILRKMVGYWSKEFLDMDMDICMYHHEKWDGRGYPRGLKGDEIPISAQIVSIADIYDALTSVRCYKKAFSYRTVANMILSGECGAFSEKLLDCFRKCRPFFEKHASDPTSMIQVSVSAGETVATVPSYEAAIENLRIHRPGTAGPEFSGSVYRRTGCFEGMRILITDDSELALAVTREVLEQEGAVTEAVTSAPEALRRIRNSEHRFDVVLMDINMPGMDGIRATELIRTSDEDEMDRMPIIAMTADGSDDDIRAILKAGADDCIGKPLSANELSKALLSCMRERSARAEKKLENTIRIAETDALTHVKSITAYTDKVTELSSRIGSGERVRYAIVMCDLNDLKKENDTYGHDSGDRYIVNCCRILCDVFCHSPVYRIGGDEFVAVLQGQDYKDSTRLMTELKQRGEEARCLPDTISGKTFFSCGIAVYDPNRDYFVSDTVKRADQEMYAEKRRSKAGTGSIRDRSDHQKNE